MASASATTGSPGDGSPSGFQCGESPGGRLIGVVFYGRHRNGTEIDPEEMALLRRLCEAAAAAYETAEMRAEVAELRAQTADLLALVAALKAQPA